MIIPTILAITATLIIFSLSMQKFITSALNHSLVGIDYNKIDLPEVAEAGGIIIILSYLVGLFFFLPFIPTAIAILGTVAAASLAALIGLLDDVIPLKWRIKLLTPIAASIPLMVLRLGNPVLKLGVLGNLNLGIFYIMLVIPLITTGLINCVNMVAGYNGLEAGNVLIITAFCLGASVITSNVLGITILFPLIPTLILFMKWNKFPSKIFPGDVGTYGMGAILACWAIIADMERFLFLCLLPYFVHLFIWLRGKLKYPKLDRIHGGIKQILANGTMQAGRVVSLTTAIIYKNPGITEPQLVQRVWMFTFASCSLSLFIMVLGMI